MVLKLFLIDHLVNIQTLTGAIQLLKPFFFLRYLNYNVKMV